MYETLNNTVFLLLNSWDIIGLESTGVKGIAKCMDKNNEYNCYGTDPVNVEDPFLDGAVLRCLSRDGLFPISIESLYISVTTFCLEAASRAALVRSTRII